MPHRQLVVSAIVAMDRGRIPKHRELMLPTLQAVVTLGGSGTNREISEQVISDKGYSDDLVAVTYEKNDRSILLDRLYWARSYCKLGGVLETPQRGLYLVTELGRSLAEMPEDDAITELREIVKKVDRRRAPQDTPPENEDDEPPDDEDHSWKEGLLERLHQLSPEAFERFTLYLLRTFGMELRRQGGPGDEGIDGIGTAPLTDVLTTTVAVQAKRYEPSRTVGREIVALFQSDASAAGAEHGVLVTTGRFSEPARNAALGRTPTIELIDGDRLAELCLQQEAGIALTPTVSSAWFERFEDDP